jgi:hypothetical protein
MIESESKMLPLISKALASQAIGEAGALEEKISPAKKRPLDAQKLEEIIKDEFS